MRYFFMKRFILVLLLVLSAYGLFAENISKKEIYRNIDYDKELFMYEIYNENNEIIYYEVKTIQNYSNSTIIYIRSLDKKLLTKFLNNLRQCNNKDFKTYINNYLERATNLIFLWDDCEIVGDNIEEYYCYKLE